MKSITIAIMAMILSSCSMLGSREGALKDSMTHMTEYKGEIFLKGKMIGKSQENSMDVNVFNETVTLLKSKSLWVEPKLAEFPEIVMKNSMMGSAMNAMKSKPMTSISKYITVNDTQGNLLLKVYLLMVPASVNENNQVQNEGWLVVLDKNNGKTSLTKVKEDTSKALEYYYFDVKWPTIAEKSL